MDQPGSSAALGATAPAPASRAATKAAESRRSTQIPRSASLKSKKGHPERGYKMMMFSPRGSKYPIFKDSGPKNH